MSRQNRNCNAPRPCTITIDYTKNATGSCLIETGNTRVICTASVEENVPPFLRGQNKGWLTAEYAMLPASTGSRKKRDGLKKDGRSVEIQRLIGRALRQAVDLTKLGERTITLDCDVLDADGGTRTASITGAFVALVLAVNKLMQQGLLTENPIVHQVAAISCGIVDNVALLDLCYIEDSNAEADMNFVMTEEGDFIELQGTGEGRAFSNRELLQLLDYGRLGIRNLMFAQRSALLGRGENLLPKPKIVLASGNAHKINELQAIFGDFCTFVSMQDAGFTTEIIENGATFTENAAIKALAVMRETGLPCLADDSGLCVDYLKGEPGIHSARYAGMHGQDDENNNVLLRNMEGVTERNCHFVCAMVLALPGEEPKDTIGVCNGTLLTSPCGEGGFGYDVIFKHESGVCFGELPQEEKNKISHRAIACAKMKEILKTIF